MANRPTSVPATLPATYGARTLGLVEGGTGAESMVRTAIGSSDIDGEESGAMV